MTTVCGSVCGKCESLPRSASSSAKGSVPARLEAPVRVKLWLPDDLQRMGASLIEKEEDQIHAGGLQRCLDSLLRQMFEVSGIAQQTLFTQARQR